MRDYELERIIEELQRGAVDFITDKELAWKFISAEKERRSVVVKYGVDPTAPEVHIGHTVTLRKLRQFQDFGQQVTFLIGDFTARIGDPSGKDDARKPMTEEEVASNAETYKKQIFKILNPEKTNIVYNSSWLKQLMLENCLKLLGSGTINDLIKRRSFAKRFEEGKPVSAIELVYPFLQGYDSVFLNSDVEVGGTDQYFNLVFARELQKKYGQEPQAVITMPLLEGLDGDEKMSKSLGNHVGIDEDPKTMYAKIMSSNDRVMFKYFRLLTQIPLSDVEKLEKEVEKGSLHPMDVKMKLAFDIVSQYHGNPQAGQAQEEFINIHRHKQTPSEMPTYFLESGKPATIADVLVEGGIASSKSQARRLVQQRGVRLNNITLEDADRPIEFEDGDTINVGKRRYLQLKYK